MRRRSGYENLAVRLARRETLGAPPGGVTPASRRFYENIVPDTPVPGLVPPPNTVLSCFTPCGRFLIAFQPISNEVVAFRFKGISISSSTPSSSNHQQPSLAGAAAAANGQAGPASASTAVGALGSSSAPRPAQTAPPQPAWQLGQGPAEANGRQSQGQQAQQDQAPRQQRLPPPPPPLHARLSFGDVFEEHWRCCPCPSRREQISPDFCIVAHNSFLLVCTASAERQPLPGAAGAAQLVPTVDSTTFHLIELDSGLPLDRHCLRHDYVELSRNQGAHLRGQLLLVLGLASQTLHVLQLLPAGRLLYLHAIGQHCLDDDAWVVAQQEEQERRLRLQQQQRRQQQQQQQRSSSSASIHSVGVGAAGAPAAAAVPLPLGSAPGGGGGLPGMPAAGVGPGAAGAGGPAAWSAAADSEPSGDGSRGHSGADPGPAAATAANGVGAEGGRGQPSVLIEGLKHRLLSYLFKEAQRQSQAAAEAATLAAATAAAGAGAGAGSAQPPSSASIGSRGGSGGDLVQQAQQAQQQHQSHWRRPLDRFYFYFEAYTQMLMWKAQVLDDQRLLIHWCPPEMLAGPHRLSQGHGSSSVGAGPQGSLLMLYNMGSAEVERLFVAHSPEFAQWYLTHPSAFLGCDGDADWARCVLPTAASRAAREQQLRDPVLAAKELRHRHLSEEVPAPCQMRQATPYLDPDLYCYDERAIGGAIRPHHLPHRSLKFMCRCQPERLRFRLDPEHLTAAAEAAGAAAGGAAAGRAGAASRGAAAAASRAHAVYLFHPVHPFLLVVLQDIETGMADRLTLFTRL